MAGEATYLQQGRNIRNEFVELIASRRVTGSDFASTFGWLLGILLIVDFLRNIGDGGSPSMLVLSFLDSRPSWRGAAGVIVVTQILMAALTGLCFARSIWPAALSLPLRKSVPFAAVPRLARAWALGERPTDLLTTIGVAILSQLLLLVFFFVLLAPSIGTLSVSAGSLMLALLRVLLASYCLTWIFAAVASLAWRDKASFTGIGLGMILALIALYYAAAPAQEFVDVPDSAIALADWDLWLLLLLLTAVLSLQVGSLNRNEDLDFDLGDGDIGVIWDLPNTLNGVYLPTKVHIQGHGRKILLLSRSTKDATHYQVHTSLDGQDLFAGAWRLLNLDELSRGVPTGVVTVKCHGHSRYFICEIPLKLTTLTSDSYKGQFAAHDLRIAISELAFLHEGILRGGEVGDRLQGELDSAIRDELDTALDQALGADGNMVLSTSAASFRAAVVYFRQDADQIASLFKTRITATLRIDTLDDIIDMHVDAVKLLGAAFELVKAEYDKITGIDSARSAIGAVVEAKAKDAMTRLLNRGAPSGWQDEGGLRLFHLINLSVQPVKVDLTQEAQTLIAELKQEYATIQDYNTTKKKEMDDAVAARKASTDVHVGTIVTDPNLPPATKGPALRTYFGPRPDKDDKVATEMRSSKLSGGAVGDAQDPSDDKTFDTASPAKKPPFPD